jgi:hypothetical protein
VLAVAVAVTTTDLGLNPSSMTQFGARLSSATVYVCGTRPAKVTDALGPIGCVSDEPTADT